MLTTRQTMLETLGEDYIQTARAKGVPESAVRDRHAARNALLPVLTGLIIGLPYTLSEGLARVVQNPGNYPTARARDGGPLEDFAESVTAYLVDGYACNERWSDDDPRFYTRFGVQPDEVWAFDRYDYVARLFAGATMVEIREEADGLRVPDVVIADDDRVMPER